MRMQYPLAVCLLALVGMANAASTGPVTGTEVLTGTCGPTQNVLKWKLISTRNSNSVLRGVDGGSNEWVCGGPKSIEPCTNLNVNTFVDKNVQPGKTYVYLHKSAPGCQSNYFICPLGTSTGNSCLKVAGGGAAGGAGGGAGGGTGGHVVDVQECTGGNPLCLCVKDVGAYRRYISVAQTATEAAFPGLTSKPFGMSDGDATKKICEAYNANKTLGPDSECRSQNDEIVLQDPDPNDLRYPATSLDVITWRGVFWAKPIAACAPGVH